MTATFCIFTAQQNDNNNNNPILIRDFLKKRRKTMKQFYSKNGQK